MLTINMIPSFCKHLQDNKQIEVFLMDSLSLKKKAIQLRKRTWQLIYRHHNGQDRKSVV